jgi:hypothetical protein
VSGGNSTCLPLEDRTQEQRKEMEQQDEAMLWNTASVSVGISMWIIWIILSSSCILSRPVEVLSVYRAFFVLASDTAVLCCVLPGIFFMDGYRISWPDKIRWMFLYKWVGPTRYSPIRYLLGRFPRALYPAAPRTRKAGLSVLTLLEPCGDHQEFRPRTYSRCSIAPTWASV